MVCKQEKPAQGYRFFGCGCHNQRDIDAINKGDAFSKTLHPPLNRNCLSPSNLYIRQGPSYQGNDAKGLFLYRIFAAN